MVATLLLHVRNLQRRSTVTVLERRDASNILKFGTHLSAGTYTPAKTPFVLFNKFKVVEPDGITHPATTLYPGQA